MRKKQNDVGEMSENEMQFRIETGLCAASSRPVRRARQGLNLSLSESPEYNRPDRQMDQSLMPGGFTAKDKLHFQI